MSGVALPACTKEGSGLELGVIDTFANYSYLLAAESYVGVVNSIFLNDVQYSSIFLGSTTKSTKSSRGIVKQVFNLTTSQNDGFFSGLLQKLTVIVVPSFPAQGLGSAVEPSFAATR